MKKIIGIILFIAIILGTTSVHAANYEVNELIPVNTTTTIVTNNFSYKRFSYNENALESKIIKSNSIVFENIKNLTDEELPVSISIGLFDKDKRNIGTVNYCSTNDKSSFVAGTILGPREERDYVIEINKKYLAPDKSVKDVKYIAVLSDNINCRVAGSQDYVGKKIEDIITSKRSILEYNSTKFFLKTFSIISILLLIIFLYKFLFTNSFRNFNGDDVRKEFVYKNKQLAKERKKNPKPIPQKVVKEKKTSIVLKQEKDENKKENKEGTDLHNMYK